MFSGLKDGAIKKGLAVLEKEVSARVEEKVDLFQQLTPADVQDDEKYTAIVIAPLWLYVRVQSGGAIGAVQKLTDFDIESRFRKAMFQVRDELLVLENGQLVLAPGFREKLGPTIVEALKA